MLDFVREGDTLYVESISRLERSTKDLLNIIDTLTDKGVTLVSHKENIDTDTPTGKFMLMVFIALSQLEREQIKQRQSEGIEIAKAQGKYTGRKPIPIDWEKFGKLYGEWKAKNITGRDFMRRMDLSANTFRPPSRISFPCSMNSTLSAERKRLRIDCNDFGQKFPYKNSDLSEKL